jgi:hypothetical protein
MPSQPDPTVREVLVAKVDERVDRMTKTSARSRW